MASSPQGALQVIFECGFGKGDRDFILECRFLKGDRNFILLLNSNNTFTRHCCRYNQVLPLARNDVNALFTQEGAAGEL